MKSRQSVGAGPAARRDGRSLDRRRLASTVDEVGDLGIILRIDATLSNLGGPDTIMHLLHNAEEAAAPSADMVVLNCYLGIGQAEIESSLLKKLAAVSAECERIGMPLCGEIIPRVCYADPSQQMPTSAESGAGHSIGPEYGCDIVKTVYNGDPEGFAKAVASGHLPVIMAGGPKTSGEEAFFQQVHEALTHDRGHRPGDAGPRYAWLR